MSGKWRPISEVTYEEIVIIETEGGDIFKAALFKDHSINSDEQSVDQWIAEGIHPDNWTDGCCWESNADEEESDQPIHWMEIPEKPMTQEEEFQEALIYKIALDLVTSPPSEEST